MDQVMKVLVVGDWHSELHEHAISESLIKLGHEIIRFQWHGYFKTDGNSTIFHRLLLKAQNKYLYGPVLSKINCDLIKLTKTEKPDAVFIYRGTHIFPETLRTLRHCCPDTVLVGYNNDDPFSPRYPRWVWRHYLGGVPVYDLVLAYRQHNIVELRKVGAKRTELLRSWFIPERNYPLQLSEKEYASFGCDVVFVGHYEDDGRLQYLEEVVRRGWKLRMFGPGYEWDSVLSKSSLLAGLAPVRLVWGEEYNRALCGARVALCFFSKLNRDSYTRRCFEIPACKTVLMSEYSDDLASLYEADQEAIFFTGVSEMGDKLDALLDKPESCRAIAARGLLRVWEGRHDVVSRMEDVLGWIREIQEKRNECAAVNH
jgi:spore maturation protein CgeB